MSHNKILGNRGERIAEWWFNKQGYRMVSTNFKPILAEIDLIVENKEELLFIEVKTRLNKNYGDAEMAVPPYKIRAKKHAINVFVSRHPYFVRDRAIRFILLAIERENGKYRINCLGE